MYSDPLAKCDLFCEFPECIDLGLKVNVGATPRRRFIDVYIMGRFTISRVNSDR